MRNDLRNGETVAKEGLQVEEKDASDLFFLKLGNTLHDRGNYSTADEAFLDAADRFLKLGINMHEQGNYLAEATFRKAFIRARPTDSDLYLYLGEMPEEKGKNITAEKVYQDATEAALDFSAAFTNYFDMGCSSDSPTCFSLFPSNSDVLIPTATHTTYQVP